MEDDKNLDLLDLDDTSMDVLPEAVPFAAPRPKKPWLLMAVGIVVIILATYIIVRTIAGDSSTSMDVDLDAPVAVVDTVDVPVPVDVNPTPQNVNVAPAPAPMPMPAVAPQPETPKAPQQVAPQTPGVPVRVVEERREVTFNPDKPAAQPKKQVTKTATKPAAKPAPKKPAPKPQVATPKGGWYVQFGSYSTRTQAENAERQIRAAHKGLFDGKQFVILAAQLPNGTTTYRLRIAFANANDANYFCRNAKSDGLDCYVAK